MTGLESYPLGTNAFQNVPPRGADKPAKQPRTRKAKPKTLQAAISLETPEERKARKQAEATAFIHYGGICDFGVTPDHMAIKTKQSILTGQRVRLGRDI